MKKNIKKGLEKLPLFYQLSEIVEIANDQKITINSSVRPNRVIKMEVYESVKVATNTAPKPITKIL